jgi:hypothetical protein
MSLCSPYPDRVQVDGKTYELDLSLRNVLNAMEAAQTEGITPEDAVQIQCAWLLSDPKRVPTDPALCARILEAVFALFPKADKQQEKYIDFEQDAALIRSGFMRIGIDLTREDIHFLQFMELIADLPPDTALMRTVELRQRPVPEINEHNKEQVARLLEAKQRVALKLTEEERRARFERQLMQNRVFWG